MSDSLKQEKQPVCVCEGIYFPAMGVVCPPTSCRPGGHGRWKIGHQVTVCQRQWLAVMTYVLLSVTQVSGASVNAYVWGPMKEEGSSGITCWTCSEKRDNEACNTWAPDLVCPYNQTMCQTVHRLTVRGYTSLQVTKRCVHTTECTPAHVGCTGPDQSGQQVCTSCCDVSYCNQEVPVNRSSALQLSSFSQTPHAASGATQTAARPAAPLLVLLWVGVVLTTALRNSLSLQSDAVSLRLRPSLGSLAGTAAAGDVYSSGVS